MKKLTTFSFLIRFGLACAFLANSLTAFLSPDEFNELISGSYLSNILTTHVAGFVMFIAINDLVVALLLVLGWRVKWVAIWASLWLIGVMSVLGFITLDSLEHLGFLLPAIALIANF